MLTHVISFLFKNHIKTICTELLNHYIYPTQSEIIKETIDYYKYNHEDWYDSKFDNDYSSVLKWYERTLSEKVMI
jgi:hypothetical protein